jgi:hypothetical protein
VLNDYHFSFETAYFRLLLKVFGIVQVGWLVGFMPRKGILPRAVSATNICLSRRAKAPIRRPSGIHDERAPSLSVDLQGRCSYGDWMRAAS